MANKHYNGGETIIKLFCALQKLYCGKEEENACISALQCKILGVSAVKHEPLIVEYDRAEMLVRQVMCTVK